MTAQSLPTRIWYEARLYGAAIRHFRRNVRRYLLSVVFLGPGLNLFALLYNLYLLESGFTEVLVGQVAAATGMGLVFGSIPGGMLYSRWGGKIGLAAGTVTVALAQLSQLLARTPTLLLAAAFFAGVANALIFTAVHPLMADESDEGDRTYLFSLGSILWAISGMAGSLLGGLMPRMLMSSLSLPLLVQGQRAAMIVGTDFLLLALIPILTMEKGQGQSQVVAVTTSGMKMTPSRRGFVGCGVVIFFVGLALGSSYPFYNVYFHQFHQATTEQVGLIMGLSRVAGVAALVTIPAVAGRIGKVKGNLLLAMSAAPFLFLLGLPLALPLAIVFFFTGFALFQANTTLFGNVVMEVVSPRERGRQASIRIFVNYLGYSLAGLLGGQIIVHLGYGSLFAVAAVASAIAGVACWLFFRHSPAAKPIQ